jgi:hypothetical protein
MQNSEIEDQFNRIRELINELSPSRERTIALDKLGKCQLWTNWCLKKENVRNKIVLDVEDK